jgi:hypothetical protein
MMKKVIRLTESDLTRIIKRVISESGSIDRVDSDVLNSMSRCSYSEYQVPNTDHLDWATKIFHDAIYGVGTDINPFIVAISKLKNLKNFCGVAQRYKKKYNTSLSTDIIDEMDVNFKRQVAISVNALDATLDSQKTTQTNQVKPISNTRPTSCSELKNLAVGRGDAFGLELVKNELFPRSQKTKGDDYAYVKVCYSQVGKNHSGPSPKQNWIESTDPKQKTSIINHLKTRDFMGSYQDDKNPWKKQSGQTWTR